MNNKLSLKSIKQNLDTNLSFIDIDIFDSIESTNDYLKQLASNHEQHGKVIIANHQTKGKGSNNRAFYSPSNTGIYMSILVRPKISPIDTLLLTPATAVAVANAIESVSHTYPTIKWVNDIYIDNKKVCGILTESCCVNDTCVSYAVVGIGINVYRPLNNFPSDISNIAGYIFESSSTHTCDIRNILCSKILTNFFEYYDSLLEKSFYNEYKKRLFILNQTVTISNTNEKVVPIDIDDNFRLKVQYEDGSQNYISSGEISLNIT